MKTQASAIGVLCLLFSILNLRAQESNPKREDKSHSVLLYTDEDFKPIQLIGAANDQNYTMGFGFGYSAPIFNKSIMFGPNRFLARIILGRAFIEKPTIIELSPSISINGTAFTPLDLRSPNPILGDRPYAFLLTLSTKKSFLDEEKDQIFTSELNIGVLGTKIGQWVQTKIHENLIRDTANTPIPKGWDNQISKGGEPTFLYALSYEKLVCGFNNKNRSLFELKYGLGATAGYYTGVSASLSTRLGLLDNRNWFRNYSQLQNHNGLYGTPSKYSGKARTEAFLFGMIKPVYNVYNELLTGGFSNQGYRLRDEQTRHLRLEWNLGFGVTIPTCEANNSSLAISWMLNAGRTSELNTPYRRAHQWGTINLAYNFGK
ncbi:MAG: DUF2219 family protein [Pedobacter sp.]|nr:MAG: DUF2219 family protein [Pedobacter sp.]